jgi:aryl-alcohol dehydrogenase-like predicted oxidoreductase
MDTRPIGAAGVHLSRIGLGGYELGPEPHEAPDVDRAVGVIETSIAAGVNWLDTSENYLETRNETLIGAAFDRLGGCVRGRDEGRTLGRGHGRWERVPPRADPRSV